MMRKYGQKQSQPAFFRTCDLLLLIWGNRQVHIQSSYILIEHSESIYEQQFITYNLTNPMVNRVEQFNLNTVNQLYHITLKVKNCNRIADSETLIPSKPHLGEACCVHEKKSLQEVLIVRDITFKSRYIIPTKPWAAPK